MPDADVTTGTTITFETGFFAEILNVDWDGPNREHIETTHMGTTTARTFKPKDLYDAGEITVELAFNPADDPPIDQAAETCTITWPDGTTWAASAFLTGYSVSGPLEDKMTATAVLKCTGEITIT